MIEQRTHLVSRVVPDSEIGYVKAITQAIEDTQARLIKTNGTFTKKKLTALLVELNQQLQEQTNLFAKEFKKDMTEVIVIDQKLANKEASVLLEGSLYKLSKEDIASAIKARDVVFIYKNAKDKEIMSAIDIYSYYNATQKKLIENVRSTLTSGMITGQHPTEIARRLPESTYYAKHQLRTLVRTMLAENASRAEQKRLEENSEYYAYYQYIATLDIRTTSICRSLDGRRFKEIPKRYNPPLHFNCRSSLEGIPYGYKHKERPLVLPDGTVHKVNGNLSYAEAVELYPELKRNSPLNMKQFEDKILN